MDLKKIAAPVKKEVNALEIKLETILKNTILKENFNNTFLTKGKKIRPIFLFLLSRSLGYEAEDIIDYGIIVELLHNASLVHDDIIDHSDKRRGLNTFNAVYSNDIAVLMGDYLFLLANKTALEKNNIQLLKTLSEHNERLLLGEILEGFNSFRIDISEQEYMKIIKDKTASLFELVGDITSLLINADNSLKKKLIELGFIIGLSFQIIDDILDYKADKKRVGKPIMNDLVEGTITLPLIYSMKNSPDLKKSVKQYFKNRDIKLLEEIRNKIEKSGGFEYSNQVVNGYMVKAKEIISSFKDSIYTDSLNQLFDFIIKRAF
jgi:octaprenyl-diphosphate synthase